MASSALATPRPGPAAVQDAPSRQAVPLGPTRTRNAAYLRRQRPSAISPSPTSSLPPTARQMLLRIAPARRPAAPAPAPGPPTVPRPCSAAPQQRRRSGAGWWSNGEDEPSSQIASSASDAAADAPSSTPSSSSSSTSSPADLFRAALSSLDLFQRRSGEVGAAAASAAERNGNGASSSSSYAAASSNAAAEHQASLASWGDGAAFWNSPSSSSTTAVLPPLPPAPPPPRSASSSFLSLFDGAGASSAEAAAAAVADASEQAAAAEASAAAAAAAAAAATAVGRAVYEVLRVDTSGRKRRIYVKRRDLLRANGLQPRDLRRVDPSLSLTRTAPSITVKESVLLINLGGVRAIIGANKCLLFEPASVSSTKFLEILVPRLQAAAGAREEASLLEAAAGGAGGGWGGGSSGKKAVEAAAAAARARAAGGGGGGGNGAASELSDAGANEGEEGARPPPFELEALEAALVVATGRLDAELLSVTARVTRVLQMLPRDVTPVNLEELRRVKQALVELESRADNLREVLEEIMDDDDEVREMNLSSRPAREEKRRARERERLERDIEAREVRDKGRRETRARAARRAAVASDAGAAGTLVATGSGSSSLPSSSSPSPSSPSASKPEPSSFITDYGGDSAYAPDTPPVLREGETATWFRRKSDSEGDGPSAASSSPSPSPSSSASLLVNDQGIPLADEWKGAATGNESGNESDGPPGNSNNDSGNNNDALATQDTDAAEAEAALEEMEEEEEEEREIEEAEDLLEYYLQRAATTQSEAERLLAGSRDLEESIAVSLSARRFELNRLELTLSIGSFAAALGAVFAGIFGMNLRSTLEHSVIGFWGATAAIIVFCAWVFVALYAYTRKRRIL